MVRQCRGNSSLPPDEFLLPQSIDLILAWDFERVTVAHGDVLETGGRAALRESFAWLSG